jgi:hypothetical protein
LARFEESEPPCDEARCSTGSNSAITACSNGQSNEFPSLGVNALFLDAFRSRWKTVVAQEWTTSRVCNQLIKPLTFFSRSSFCDILSSKGSTMVGEATLFLSHVWNERFWDTVDSVVHAIKENGEAAMQDTFIWIDIFSTSQHIAVDRPSSWWMETFKKAIAKMGRLAMVMNPWDNPNCLKRAWCVLELFSCVSSGGHFEVAMPPTERERFLNCNKDFKAFDNMLSRINSKQSTCSREIDRVSSSKNNVFASLMIL